MLAATYLVCESNLRYCNIPYDIPNAWFVWISPKTLHSPVLASFADSKLLDFSKLAIAWFNVGCHALYTVCIHNIINPQRMRSRHSYNNRWRWSPPPSVLRSLASFRRMKPTTVASFQLEGYIWLAIHVDPTRRLAHHWSEHSGSADLASMAVIAWIIYSSYMVKRGNSDTNFDL